MSKASKPARNVSEEWRPVVGWEDLYEVSNLGRVRSLPRVVSDSNGRTRRMPMRMRKPYVNVQHGRRELGLKDSGRFAMRTVYSLVADAWIGAKPDGLEINHKNGDYTDDRAENLEYVTKSENLRHAYRLGLRSKPHWLAGANHWAAVLTEDCVREIRKRHKRGESLSDLSSEYGVGVPSIRRAVNRQTWKNVK